MQTKKANPLIWGAVGAIIMGAAISVGLLTGDTAENNPLLSHITGSTIGGFLWGYAAGALKNWYGNRINR